MQVVTILVMSQKRVSPTCFTSPNHLYWLWRFWKCLYKIIATVLIVIKFTWNFVFTWNPQVKLQEYLQEFLNPQVLFYLNLWTWTKFINDVIHISFLNFKYTCTILYINEFFIHFDEFWVCNFNFGDIFSTLPAHPWKWIASNTTTTWSAFNTLQSELY